MLPPHSCHTKGKISNIDQNHFLYQAVNIRISAVKLGIGHWAFNGGGGGVYGDSLPFGALR